MRTHGSRPPGRPGRAAAWAVLVAGLSGLGAAPAHAVSGVQPPLDDTAYRPAAGFVTDGSTVMNAGELQVHLTNWGLIGSAPGSRARFSEAPAGQWPAGSGIEYLYSADLWVGGRILGEKVVSMGGLYSEWLPRDEIEATLYEAVNGQIIRPLGNPRAGGNRKPMPGPDDDGDGLVDEEILNGHDDDDDGAIDEDFGQIGSQMMVCTIYDNTRLAQERYPDHTPLQLEAVQHAVQWENDAVDDFVGFDYTITNVGVIDAEHVYIGFFADCDIGPRASGDVASDDMAGSWRGMVRASDGGWVPVDVGYMYDAAENDRVEGYFGVLFLGHDIDPTGRNAPQQVGLRTFQSFSSNAAFEQGGDPTNDEQAYELLSALPRDRDANTRPGSQADFRILVSAGPFRRLEPGRSLGFQVAMVCGSGLGTATGGRGLLAHCAEAWLTWHGIYLDEIAEVSTLPGQRINPGQRGRETMLCLEDFGPDTSDNPFYSFIPDYMDTSCIDPLWAVAQQRVRTEDMFHYGGKTCAMFNLDNCFECARQLGRECGTADFAGGAWTCADSLATDQTGCTGIDGLETQIHWLVGMAPPPPGMRLWPGDGRVHVYWDDSSEHSVDVRLQTIDFESYRVWRADNWSRPFGSSLENGPESGLWQMIAEFDVVNDYVARLDAGDTTVLDTLPLGRNTGLGVVAYRPGVLDEPRYAGLAEAMQEVVDADPQGLLNQRPELRDENGLPRPGFVGLLRWETEPDVLDTFFAVAARPAEPAAGVVGKRGTRFYEYVDRDIHNGFLYFYAVTATDHDLQVEDGVVNEMPRGPGQVGDPGSSFNHGVPGSVAQTAAERASEGANIYVYPNPATRDALGKYQQFDPTGDDPTGVRVTFANLPAARSTIRIYTVAGDLVQELHHDGTTGTGHVSWNLMSRNLQEIVSGVYLYAVQADDGRFEDVVGKFVVVR